MSADPATLKDEGNALFAKKQFQEAYAKYSEAIELANDAAARAVLYSNRAQCCLMMERWQDAKLDAAESLQADIKNAKAWHRLGRAYIGAGHLDDGIRVYQAASHVLQSDRSVVEQFKQGVQEGRRLMGVSDLQRTVQVSPTSQALQRALRLKEEGNALVNAAPGDFITAAAKFTLALVYDPFSAILFSNHAYCANSLKSWDEAIIDAKRAITLDEGFAKAWTRLGAAKLGKNILHEAEDAFNQGLKVLKEKPEPLSPADARMQASIEQSIADIKASTRKVQGLTANKSIVPWVLADAVINDHFVPTDRSTWYSSSWVICAAYRDFSQGLQKMFQNRVVGPATFGSLGVVELLSNGLIYDNRAFHVNQPEFVERYQTQLLHEANSSQAFSETGAERLIVAVKSRLQSRGGWGNGDTATSVLSALGVTIRSWLLNAFVMERLAQDLKKSLTLYKGVVDFIELGRQEWATVPRTQRGSIFELTWLLGVERNYAEALRVRYKSNMKMKIPDNDRILDRIKSLGEKMLAQLATFTEEDKIPRGDRYPEFILAFMVYPEACANECIAFYHHHLAWLRKNPSVAMPLLATAAEYYGKAAAIYPKDEELRTEALFNQMTTMFRCGRPLRESLPVADELKQSIEDKKRIWRGLANQMDGHLDKVYAEYVAWAVDVRAGLADGQFTMNDPIICDLVHRMDW
ncbi:TPR-like protein [Auricularia subglabra TFB-10046 SS5]|nr:TPR-like protein [Auricularia subglabra TFB-10046 SS5]